MMSTEAASGRFVLRMDSALHTALRSAAAEAGLSLNEYCVRKLALPGGSVTNGSAEAVVAAARIAGTSLIGVVSFGSWARGELGEESDVDVLIVLAREIPIERTLYTRWDETPVCWEGHPVEPHFVHPPADGSPVAGVWAEVAVDGIILFERDYLVSRALVSLRQRIAAGEVVRRTLHGQHYWVEVA